MNETKPGAPSRRNFLASSALAGVTLPHVHAAQNNTIQIALIGSGGRGTGAAGDALQTKAGPVKLTAMVDVIPKKLNDNYDKLKTQFASQVDVPPDRRFLGYNGYKQAMDTLRPGDVVILSTPPAFRWVMFSYAIEKGLNVFMEKPVTVDGPSTRRMLKLAELSVQKNLKCAVGLMVRHCRARQELYNRIRNGEIGDIVAMRGYRMGQGGGTCGPRPADIPELQHQIQHFHAFLWLSGGVFSDYYIHQIDECSWMKGSWPIEAHAVGGRHYRGDSLDQNFDTYSVQYEFADGTRLFFDGRNMAGCRDEFASYAHGTKGSAVISTLSHTPGITRIYKSQKMPRVNSRRDLPLPANPDLAWAFPQPEKSPYQWEWDDLMDAIRNDKPYNEVKRGAEASLVGSMGRMAAHTGQIVTFDQMLNCQHEFAPDVDKIADGGASPLRIGADGRYPIPQPGILKDREY